MKKILKLITLLIICVTPVVNAKSMKATDYIKKIANDAGGNNNSIDEIGDTSLAYDGTTDNNLRYIGANPRNYISFNDELWRIVGVMNNIEDENGNKSSKVKIVRAKPIFDLYWDVGRPGINERYGINEWSQAALNKVLNPGFEHNIDSDYSSSEYVNNSLYWNRQTGKCLYNAYSYPNYYTSARNCDFSTIGIKNEFKQYIAKVKWNTGTVEHTNSKNYKNLYNMERGPAEKCTRNDNKCNDNVDRTSSVIENIGLLYTSDYVLATSGGYSKSRIGCLNSDITLWDRENCDSKSWINTGYSLSPAYISDTGYCVKIIHNSVSTGRADEHYDIYPALYLNDSALITNGNGSQNNPYTINNNSPEYSHNTVNSKYNGNYSIDYLSRNYSLIALGTKTNNHESHNKSIIYSTKKGDVKDITNVEGPVLVRGNYTVSKDKGTLAYKNRNLVSFIKGNLGKNIKVDSNITNNSNYVDFDKMHAQITNEQKILVDKTEYKINEQNILIKKPGIYMINNTMPANSREKYGDYIDNHWYYSSTPIVIEEYKSTDYYIFNIMDLFVVNGFKVLIKQSNQPNTIEFENFVKTGNYSGNIIFNFPNARYIRLTFLPGKIIAPNADIDLREYYIDDYNKVFGTLTDCIIANSITGNDTDIKYYPNTVNKKLIVSDNKEYAVVYNDYNDDLYTGDYSIKSLIENYNVVTLGTKDYQDKSKYKSLGYAKGSAAIFHIAGPFLVNGDLGTTGENYPGSTISNYGSNSTNNMRLDLDSNLMTESNVKGNFKTDYYIKNWYAGANVFGSINKLYTKNDPGYIRYNEHYKEGLYITKDQFLNYQRIYENIVAQQKGVYRGKEVKSEDEVAHIKIGNNFFITDINQINEIIFDNFDDNKDKLTIITIENEGDINFPKISADTIGLVETNDYFGKKRATQEYEMNRELTDKYYGNIIWNIPNAKYVKLAENTPFFGHIIAPNADVESPETQLAGAIIANSFYAEGASEAHFYPITVQLDCDCPEYHALSAEMKMRFHEYRLYKELGGDASKIETTVVGDQVQYRKDLATLEHTLSKCPSYYRATQITKNPFTHRVAIIVIMLVVGLSCVGIHTYKQSKKDNLA